MQQTPYHGNRMGFGNGRCDSGDRGPEPYTVNVLQKARQNVAFRSALWTGNHLQMTLMSIPVGEDIGAEVHPDTDQYIRVEEGNALSKLGSSPEQFKTQQNLSTGEAVFVPAGTWHNIINVGHRPLKLSSVYAPPNHPRCTLHRTKQDAQKASY